MTDTIAKRGYVRVKRLVQTLTRIPLTMKERAEKADGRVKASAETPLTVPLMAKPTAKKDVLDSKTAGICDKLDNLREHFPNQNEKVYELAALLSERLKAHGYDLLPGDELLPEAFVNVTNLLLFDLTTGVNGFTHEAMRTGLVGYPPMLSSMVIPVISRKVCPPEFADEVAIMRARIAEACKKK